MNKNLLLLLVLLGTILFVSTTSIVEGGKKNKATKKPTTRAPTKKKITKSPTFKPTISAPTSYNSELVVNASFPTALDVDIKGNIWYTQRYNGQVRIVDPKLKTDTLFAEIPGFTPFTNDSDITFGLSLHPEMQYVYVYCTRFFSGQSKINVVRIRIKADGSAGDQIVLFEMNKQTGQFREGGGIKYHDNSLYIIIGDDAKPANSQNLSSNAGKILRFNPTTPITPIKTNPFNSLIYAYGFRNSIGFAFDPITNNMWQSENGQSCNDEINLIVSGGNYGWGPSQNCSLNANVDATKTNLDGPNIKLPKKFYSTSQAPTGIAFCDNCGLDGGNYAIFMADFLGGRIRRFYLNDDRTEIVQEDVVFTKAGGVIGLTSSKFGMYFTTSSAIYKLVN